MTIPLRILLVEDSPDDAELIMLQLEQDGLDVEYQRVDTEAAFIAALDSAPDLILSDYALPQLDSLRSLRLLNQRMLDIPFILISGMVGEEIAVDAIKHGADDYLMKDRLGRLVPAIQQALAQKRLRAEKARADEALRESEARFRVMADCAPVLIWLSGPDKRCTYFNKGWLDFTGRMMHQELGDGWATGVHPDDLERCLYIFTTTFDARQKFRMEYRLRRHDGEYRWVVDEGTPLFAGDEFTGYIGSCIDITERKRAEQALQEAGARYRMLVEQMPTVMYVNAPDEAGTATYVSPQVEAMLGYPLAEWKQDAYFWHKHVHPDDYEQAVRMIPAVLSHTRADAEYRMLARDGRVVWVRDERVLIRDTTGQPSFVQGFLVDVTERKRAEEERRQLEARMQQAQKLESLGILAGGIAHDFNNLLTSMLGYASLALMELPAESGACPMLREIEQAARRAADLTQQLLAYSGRGRFMIHALQLDAVVREMTKLLGTVVSKKAALHLDLAPATIEADATQVRQVVMNLITNASDALEGQSGVIRVCTGVLHADAALLRSPYLQEALPAGDYAYVEVEDNGCGMTEETLARIFDPFFTTKFTGRGLGLAAVLGIAKGHKGTIKVSSTLGQGTVFQALFPCARAAPGEVSVVGSEGTAQRGQGTVLVVEDEESVRSFTRRALERAGFRVREASDGRAGLDLFVQYAHEFVAVLLDLTMPRMDGQEVLLQLRHLEPNIPVLVMSGYSDLEVSARFAGMGASWFIQKPFHPRDLITLVCRMVSSNAVL